MCGIAGFIAPKLKGIDLNTIAGTMIHLLHHRGPDDSGIWIDKDRGVALAHRRLSIIDRSTAGHQPMISTCGRFILIFNGEIYNHLELRKRLPFVNHWRGNSDTETLLNAIVTWGMESTLRQAVGMFSFVLWDRSEHVLTLVRDRMGEKPLYYGIQNGALLFASELKALKSNPFFKPDISRNAIVNLLQFGSIDAPHSIYKGICKLLPGTFLQIQISDISKNSLSNPQSYWSLEEVIQHGQKNLFTGSVTDATNQLDNLLRQSLSGQMIADVNLGAFLSGGIDSSTIVALMQAQSSKPINTFTIGFSEDDYNEAKYARDIASYLGTDHVEHYVTAQEALAVIPRLPYLYDEPFADASMIPTFMLCDLAKRDVTVCLSGDGGDELFGGYNRYVAGSKIWQHLSLVPFRLRKYLAVGMNRMSPEFLDFIFKNFASILPISWQVSTPSIKFQKIIALMGAASSNEVYYRLRSHWLNPEEAVIDGTGFLNSDERLKEFGFISELEHQMMYLDALSYLPDDILVKIDRAAMGVSLETRVPMLDHRIVEFAWTLPLSMKIHDQQGKWLLRKVLNRYLPNHFFSRPKTGFSVPLDSWLRGPLRDWAEDLIDHEKLVEQGFFRPNIIRKIWKEHLASKHNWSAQLWSVLMFQAWFNVNHKN